MRRVRKSLRLKNRYTKVLNKLIVRIEKRVAFLRVHKPKQQEDIRKLTTYKRKLSKDFDKSSKILDKIEVLSEQIIILSYNENLHYYESVYYSIRDFVDKRFSGSWLKERKDKFESYKSLYT
jgi:hypothetical protein